MATMPASSPLAVPPPDDLTVEAILDGIGEGFFALDPEWRFIAFNPAAEIIFNITRTHVIGRTIWDVSPGIVGTEFERRYRQAMTERSSQTFQAYSALRPDRFHEVRVFPCGKGIGVAFLDISSREKTSQALRDREAELARVQRIGGIGGLEVDLVGDFYNRRSPEYLFLHGLPPGSVNETHAAWVARLHPDDREWVEQHFLDTVASHDLTYKVEYRIIRPSDGAQRWIRASGEIERDADGRALKLVGAHMDITDRKLAERALAESEERFRSIANSAPVPIWVSRLDGRREFVNQAYIDFLGLSPEEALKFDWRRALHVDDLPRLVEEQRIGEASLQFFTMEGRYHRGDGQWRWLRSESQPRWSSAGVHDGFIGVAHDVTESKRAAQELTQLNEILELRIEQRSSQLAATEAVIRTFFQHSSECHAVFVETYGGSFVFEEVNSATLQLYRQSREDVVGRQVADVVGPEAAAYITAHLGQALRSSLPYRYERIEGDRTIEAIVTPVPADLGSQRRLVVSARDVSERRRLEDQLRQAQKMEAVGQLTGGIAHDFNNLLTIVMGGLESIGRQAATLDASPAKAKIIRSKDMALQGVQRAATLTSRLLAFSRQQALVPQVIDANKLVVGVYDMLRRTIGEIVSLQTVLATGLWHTFADPNQLENAIVNLAVNSRDAMPNGGKLVIETQNTWLSDCYLEGLSEPVAPGQYVMIAVADTGAGMDRATMERAFDPFFTTKDVGKGTGLGLSQVYGFTRQSAGHVRIYSEPGAGTTIKIYLPRHIGPEEEDDDAQAVDDVAGAKGSEAVLVVEDDDALRGYTTEILRELGYQVTEAASGVQALDRLGGDDRIDLLLTDIVMAGGINGRELADRALLIRPELKVLFMTGYSRNAIIHDGRVDIGIQMIGKPFSFQELATKVRARLDRTD
jgi:PAS domain S-box-containing protein